MVVQYTSGHEGSVMSFFTITPRVLCGCTGSVIKSVLPQVCITVALSFLAMYLDDRDMNPFANQEQPVALGILVTFLLVFETQSAYNQFWQALTHLDGMLQTTRTLAMISCCIFERGHSTEVKVRVRRIVRMLVLHFWVVVEHFQRTGANGTTNTDVQDGLRNDVRCLVGKDEFLMLYPNEPFHTPGSKSRHLAANSVQVLFWNELSAGRLLKGGTPHPPIMACYLNHVHNLMQEVANMEKIDKSQFPFPYNQIVKILVIVYTFTLPFFQISASGAKTPVMVAFVTLGLFGLDEVAEILESPFGSDPNDIYLRQHGVKLMCDLEMFYNDHEIELDTVFQPDQDVNFSGLIRRHFSDIHNRDIASCLERKSAVDTLLREASANSKNEAFVPPQPPEEDLRPLPVGKTANEPLS
mmetsp:Transcript_73563/g.142293  ORF Transcript_73563/g.142293 Transcript_73563/m.142293 type:complete len:412 (+) Transcript_73563:115-1350(+)